jgi:hypothetical protein
MCALDKHVQRKSLFIFDDYVKKNGCLFWSTCGNLFQIYIFLWFWIGVLLLVTLMNAICWYCMLFGRKNREKFVFNYLRVNDLIEMNEEAGEHNELL